MNTEVHSNIRGLFKITHQLLAAAEMYSATNVTEWGTPMYAYAFTAAPKQAGNVEI